LLTQTAFYIGSANGNQLYMLIKGSRIMKMRLSVIASVTLLFPILSHAQFFQVPEITGATRVPACASSANGTGHIICVVGDIHNDLSAVSVAVGNQAFPASPLDPPAGNPLHLGVVGFVGDSSCASTADGSGDVVCAYLAQTAGQTSSNLMGIRFNIFTGTIYPLQNFGLGSTGTPSCTNGNERFTVTGPPTQEGPAGATICAMSGAGSALIGIAFNPATGYLRTQSFNAGIIANSNPSCSNSTDGKNQIICVYRRATSVRSIAFDPRQSPQFATAEQVPYSGVAFERLGQPSCSPPNDGSGQVICGIRDNFAFDAFALDPRSGYASPLATIATSAEPNPFTGSPSCSGEGKSTVIPNGVICAVPELFPSATDSNATLILGFIFNPRTSSNGGSTTIPGAPLAIGDVRDQMSEMSCTFQNINPNQVSCGGVSASGGFFVDIFTH
jgi:hypothetical protein